MIKKTLIFSAMMAAMLAVADAQAQNLAFGASAVAEDHLGVPVTDGSLVQLIWTTSTASGGTPPPPTLTGNGLNAGETLIAFPSTLGGGFFAGSIPNLTSAAAGEASVLYLRVFEAPSSGVAGELPDTSMGLWYADAAVVQVVPDLGPAGQPGYSYFVDINQNDWLFIPNGVIPEPSSLAFIVLAICGLAIRRRFTA